MIENIDNSGNIVNCNGLDYKKKISSNKLISTNLFINNINVYLTMIKPMLQLNLQNKNCIPYELDFTFLDFQGMNFSNVDFSHANLTGVNFAGATLVNAIFSCANLTGVNFSGANLTNADISNSNITGIIGINANITGLKLSHTIGVPSVPFCTNLSDGIIFNSYDGYFFDDILYTSTSRHGLNCESTGIINNLSSLKLGTNNNFIDGNNQLMFTITWEGFFYAKITGTYEFSLKSDDGSYFWLNIYSSLRTKTNATIDNSSQHPALTKTAKLNLIRGCYYPLFIIYGQNLGDYTCSFTFIPPTGDTEQNISWFSHKQIQ